MPVFSREIPAAGEQEFIHADVHQGGVMFTSYTTNMQYGGSGSSSRSFAQVLAGDVPHQVPPDMLAEVQEAVRAMSVDDGPNAWDPEGYTRLMCAADTGNRAEVERLLAAGAEVDATGLRDKTSLQLAAVRAHGEIVQVLLAAGANASRVQFKDIFNSWTKFAPIVRALLAAGASVSGEDILYASVCNDRESLKLLLDARPELRAALQALLAAVKSIGEANDAVDHGAKDSAAALYAAAPAKTREAWAVAPDDLKQLLPYQAEQLSTGTFETSRWYEYVDEIQKLLG